MAKKQVKTIKVTWVKSAIGFNKKIEIAVQFNLNVSIIDS